jgi:YD repeat-containing protein
VHIGWTYTNEFSEVETYNTAGQLTAIVNPADLAQTLTYDGSNRRATVTDSLGRSLTYAYDTNSHIATITDPSGGIYTYTYDSNNNLKSVTYPDTHTRTYLYGEAANVSATPASGVSYTHALTGIIDENGNRYASWTYDAQGRATSSEHGALGSGIDKVTLAYSAVSGTGTSTTTVTDPLNTTRTYNFITALGVIKNSGITGQPCNGCSAVFTYDANGNVASRTDFNGNKTTYGYDLSRNLEATHTEGLTTAGAAITGVTRTITTTWDTTWRLPTQIEEYAGATATGTPVKRTTLVYDTKGNLTSRTETDPALSLNRTATITYTYSTTIPGLVLSKVVDGPRSDVSDSTTYTYYDETDSCVGCRGELKDITDALGRVTHFNDYNLSGQLLTSTDPNGLVSTNTYDARQRLLSRTVGTETTTLTYDGVGQVTQLTLPDSSALSYTYDNAHRLTKVQDTLGNSISYTLDAMGNRIEEDIKDPANALTRHLARTYDALNRLQALTGIGQD